MATQFDTAAYPASPLAASRGTPPAASPPWVDPTGVASLRSAHAATVHAATVHAATANPWRNLVGGSGPLWHRALLWAQRNRAN